MLLSSTDSLQVINSGSTPVSIDYTIRYETYNVSTGLVAFNTAEGNIGSNTTTTLIPAPAAGNYYEISFMTFYNNLSGTQTLKLQKYNGVTSYTMIQTDNLILNYSLQFKKSIGFSLCNDTGAPITYGLTGATGPLGATGLSGAQGASGSTGTQGASGSTGPVGATGFQGASGATGPTLIANGASVNTIQSVDYITSNGNNTTWVLSSVPSSNLYVLVNLNGVLQLSNAYTVSGNTITFSEKPYANALIQVTTLAANLVASVGATGAAGPVGATGVTPSTITVSTNTTNQIFYPVFVSANTGAVSPYVGMDGGFTFNAASNNITVLGGISKRIYANTTVSGNITINWASYDEARLTIIGNTNIFFANAADAGGYVLRLLQGGTGGNTVSLVANTLQTNVRFSTTLASYTLTTTVGATDRLGFIYNADRNTYDFVALVSKIT